MYRRGPRSVVAVKEAIDAANWWPSFGGIFVTKEEVLITRSRPTVV
jgi:hypothetical protein